MITHKWFKYTPIYTYEIDCHQSTQVQCLHNIQLFEKQAIHSIMQLLSITIKSTECSPKMLIVLLWYGSIPIPSRHTTRVPLRCVVTVTVAVDVMDVPVTASVTVNWNGGSEITLPWSRGRRDREMFINEMFHWCPLEGIVHVNVTLSLGHGLSALDCNWAHETEKEQCCSYLSLTTQHTKSNHKDLLSFFQC